MNDDEFIARYAGIYEHSPWVAERACARIDDAANTDEVAARMADCVNAAARSEQLALIRAHPDLAARVAAPLTEASRDEQASAGLDRLTPADFDAFQSLNAAYRDKFGFPFVIAVRDRTPAEVLAEFRRRMDNDAESEFATALAEIHKIARLRLDALGAVS